ncbi:hypothetical protein AHF37_01547 [Paragonimus kellicotti]|nr:hypothetical protein AHF37_01547 [Paragonimus kellicotti]
MVQLVLATATVIPIYNSSAPTSAATRQLLADVPYANSSDLEPLTINSVIVKPIVPDTADEPYTTTLSVRQLVGTTDDSYCIDTEAMLDLSPHPELDDINAWQSESSGQCQNVRCDYIFQFAQSFESRAAQACREQSPIPSITPYITP